MATSAAFIALVIFSAFSFASATHFRGGTLSWRHLRTYGAWHEIEFEFRFGWRRSYFNPMCDNAMIADQSLGHSSVNWQVVDGSRILQFSSAIKCTTFDEVQDWAYGYNSFAFNTTGTSLIDVSFQGAAWISTLYNGADGDWSVSMQDVDIRPRSDTGAPNSPPRTLSSPIVEIRKDCEKEISIPILDEDGDDVTCHYAQTPEECGAICDTYPHFRLNETSCTIHYDGGGGPYPVAVAIMLEDHPPQSIYLGGNRLIRPEDPISRVPLQFIVNLTQVTIGSSGSTPGNVDPSSCNVVPSYPPESIPDGTTVPVGGAGGDEETVFNETLSAYPSVPDGWIDRFIVIGPVGVQQSGVIILAGNIYAVIIWWFPTPDQVGEHTLCYYAVDNLGKSSQQRCITIVVAAGSACDAENGGCSDQCQSDGSGATCSCSDSCWGLARNDRTCIPSMTVNCDGEAMAVSVPQCATGQPIVAASSKEFVNEPSCRSGERGSDHFLTFSASQCGTAYQVSAAGVEYLANVWVWVGETFESGSVITRGEWKRIPVSCVLPANANLTGSFLPELPYDEDFLPSDVTIEGMGTFTFYFEFYQDSGFTNVFSPAAYPVRVTVNDELYFALGAVGRTGLEIFAEDCVAMSAPTLDDSELVYYFIQNGCELDPTLETYASSNPMEVRYSIDAFQFEEKLFAKEEDSTIFIQCSVILCDSTAADSRCKQGCVPSSKKRRSAGSAIVRLTDGRSQARMNNALDDDDDAPPPLEYEESPPQKMSTRIVLAGTGEGEDDGGDGSVAYVANWMTLITAVVAALLPKYM